MLPVRAQQAYLILCRERIPFDRQCLSVIHLTFCAAGFVSAMKQRVNWFVGKVSVWLCNKIVGLDLAPFSEMVENHLSQLSSGVENPWLASQVWLF